MAGKICFAFFYFATLVEMVITGNELPENGISAMSFFFLVFWRNLVELVIFGKFPGAAPDLGEKSVYFYYTTDAPVCQVLFEKK